MAFKEPPGPERIDPDEREKGGRGGVKTPYLLRVCVCEASQLCSSCQEPFCNRQCVRDVFWSANHSLRGTDGLTNVNSSLAPCAPRCQVHGERWRSGPIWDRGRLQSEPRRRKRGASELIKTVMTVSSARHCWFSFILFNFLACTRLIAKFPRRDSRCLPPSTEGQQRNTGAKVAPLRWHYEGFINCISNELFS